MRFRLRTLLIVLALGPMVLAGGYWAWERLQRSPSHLYQDGDSVPLPRPGYHYKVERNNQQFRVIEVPDEK
jgi:hypothetical protein